MLALMVTALLACPPPTAAGGLTSVEVVWLPWNLETRGALSEDKLLHYPDARHTPIVAAAALREIEARYRGLSRHDRKPLGDIRLVAHLTWRNGSRTWISFPRTCEWTNTETCGVSVFDPVLLETLAAPLPASEQEAIRQCAKRRSSPTPARRGRHAR